MLLDMLYSCVFDIATTIFINNLKDLILRSTIMLQQTNFSYYELVKEENTLQHTLA